jgi:hypothetical protein
MHEPLSPELALVDPDLAARARAALPDFSAYRTPVYRTVRPAAPASVAVHAPAQEASARPYPIWARVTAALWLLVLGILIGGAAIPHAQDLPRVVPSTEDPAAICKPASTPAPITVAPTIPPLGSPLRPGP